jgi:peroxiredoxin
LNEYNYSNRAYDIAAAKIDYIIAKKGSIKKSWIDEMRKSSDHPAVLAIIAT